MKITTVMAMIAVGVASVALAWVRGRYIHEHLAWAHRRRGWDGREDHGFHADHLGPVY